MTKSEREEVQEIELQSVGAYLASTSEEEHEEVQEIEYGYVVIDLAYLSEVE